MLRVNSNMICVSHTNSNMICVSHTNMCDTHIIDDLKSGSGTPGEKLKVFAVEKEKALF